MSTNTLNAYQNPEGRWLAISKVMGGGCEHLVTFVDDINDASTLNYIPHGAKEKILCELKEVQVIRNVSIVGPMEPTESAIDVGHWADCKKSDPVKNFEIAVLDRRKSQGQFFIDVAANDKINCDVLNLTVEINRLPGKLGAPPDSMPNVPCVHMHFDDDDMAASFFKVDSKRIIFRPESGVVLQERLLNDGDVAYELISMH